MWHPQYQPKGQWNAENFRSIDWSGTSSTKDKSVLIDTNRIVRKRTLSQSETDGMFDCFFFLQWLVLAFKSFSDIVKNKNSTNPSVNAWRNTC